MNTLIWMDNLRFLLFFFPCSEQPLFLFIPLRFLLHVWPAQFKFFSCLFHFVPIILLHCSHF